MLCMDLESCSFRVVLKLYPVGHQYITLLNSPGRSPAFTTRLVSLYSFLSYFLFLHIENTQQASVWVKTFFTICCALPEPQ